MKILEQPTYKKRCLCGCLFEYNMSDVSEDSRIECPVCHKTYGHTEESKKFNKNAKQQQLLFG